MRHICYITGTRADFGLITSTLRLIQADPRFKLSIVVTGMHLAPEFGLTVREIEAEGFEILGHVPCEVANADGAQMARNIGVMLQGFTDLLLLNRPDIVLLLGDRGEMLAGALAGVHLGIPVVHIHGGERSGTVDEPVRHAISKLSHLHLTATAAARERLIRMGEQPELITVVGAPGLDGLDAFAGRSRDELCNQEGLDAARRLALLVFHPVLQEADCAGAQIRLIAQQLLDSDYQVLALMPNADSGSLDVRMALQEFADIGNFVIKTHLPRQEFVAWMAIVDLMIGNSSSGIIEAASFGTPVINLGTRQNMRERNSNVLDVPVEAGALRVALSSVPMRLASPYQNVYGDGKAGEKIVHYLAGVSLTQGLLNKCNAY
ncbi:UDP-N-acetylglucosamine 2-epimerase [Chitinimonas taiwanensis]|uniref:GDP/UDP-N,N'-diacetylbacillosamine 2-epimerase (Hydrolysing) n=1 Tax=Chitinimonas taiwanensis DSM 18899 TaxID=1121279 RepID=A0A1K2HQA7_9NEIS|nr:UDP-N-acetylglucosamine 2-epimerase [Chitinimonas taiwanensis]SFZ78877.1 GDP/UDP-N,N'-diacetylbacillosamine 2-epimerase (hydrolysing) [Chitinimonas taiwanensis DSM 18899]